MKSPPVQYHDDVAHQMVEDFIAGQGAARRTYKILTQPGYAGLVGCTFIDRTAEYMVLSRFRIKARPRRKPPGAYKTRFAGARWPSGYSAADSG